MNIKIEVNGVFHRRLIQKRMIINLHENAGLDDLLRIVDKKMGLSQDSLEEGNWILLLNGRRLDLKDEVQLNEEDTLSILSPLAGG